MWFSKKDLFPFLILVSEMISYKLDESDWEAILFGLKGTSTDENWYFGYTLYGQPSTPIKLALDKEGMLFYEIIAPDKMEEGMKMTDIVLNTPSLTLSYKHSWHSI